MFRVTETSGPQPIRQHAFDLTGNRRELTLPLGLATGERGEFGVCHRFLVSVTGLCISRPDP